MTRNLAAGLTAAAKALAGAKSGAHIRRTSGEQIQGGELRGAETARKAGARQTQHRAHGVHAQAREAG